MPSVHRATRQNAPGSRGSGALEFVMVMPFMLLILALTGNAYQFFRTRQKAVVAAGEMGRRYLAIRLAGTDASETEVAQQVAREIFGQQNVRTSVQTRGNGSDVNGALSGGGIPGLDSFFQQLEGIHTFAISVRNNPMFGRFESQEISIEFNVEAGTWTYHDTGDLLDWIKKSIPFVGGSI